MCQERVKYSYTGYDVVSDQCKRKAKFLVKWETKSGVYEREYCNQHKIKNVRFIEDSPFCINLCFENKFGGKNLKVLNVQKIKNKIISNKITSRNVRKSFRWI